MPVEIAVVPVAGLGTRLLPATKSQPKEMLPVGRKPVVQYVVEELAASGIRRILFVTGARKTAIENHFDEDGELTSLLRQGGKEDELAELDFSRNDMEYYYTRQRRQLGLGHAVLCARTFVGSQSFVVALGDSIIGLDGKADIVARMIGEYESGADLVVAFEEVDPADTPKYGIAQARGAAGERFELERVVEKPDVKEAPSNLAVAARYVFSPAIFDKLAETKPGKGGEIQLTDAIQMMLDDGSRGIGMRLPKGEHRFDIGNFESYFQAFVQFALADSKCGASLRRSVRSLLDSEPRT